MFTFSELRAGQTREAQDWGRAQPPKPKIGAGHNPNKPREGPNPRSPAAYITTKGKGNPRSPTGMLICIIIAAKGRAKPKEPKVWQEKGKPKEPQARGV